MNSIKLTIYVEECPPIEITIDPSQRSYWHDLLEREVTGTGRILEIGNFHINSLRISGWCWGNQNQAQDLLT